MSIRDIFILMLALLALSVSPVCASADTKPVSIGLQQQMHSPLLNETRTYDIALPRGYEEHPDRRYPLLLTFDAEALFGMSATMLESLASAGAAPEMIVVSVRNTDRWRDLTPVADPSMPGTGGGARFMDFIADELIPELQARWRVGNYKVLAGHSLGGLMAYYDLAYGRHSFDAYLALSPSLSVLEHGFDAKADAFVSSLNAGTGFAYFSIAGDAADAPYFDALQTRARDLKASTLHFEDFSQTDDHHSVRAPALLSGLRALFAGYRLLPQEIIARTDEELDAFYAQASLTYKMPLRISPMDLTNAAYWGLESDKTRARALALFERGVARWPNDAYVWSCLAEGLERTNRIPEAKRAIATSVRIGRASGFGDMAYLEGIKARIDALE